MPVVLNNNAPVNPASPEYAAMLEKLQGNILKGHGRDFSANIFLQFTEDSDSTRLRLRGLSEYVTSAARQLRESEEFKRLGIPGAMFGNIFLTAKGYKQLNLEEDAKSWFVETPTPVPVLPQNAAFLDGMLKAAADLGDFPEGLTAATIDPDKHSLLQQFQVGAITDPGKLDPLEQAYLNLDGKEIHAMLLLADDNEDKLLSKVRELIDEIQDPLDGYANVLAIELGKALRTDDGEGIEHFGYVDGRSQPLYLTTDFDVHPDSGARIERINEKTHRKESGAINIWDPFAPLDLVLIEDKGATKEGFEDAFGSYFVFRKLEQDVMRFSIAEQVLADKLKLDDGDRARAGAMIVGRFRDGTPLVTSDTDGFIPAKANNFRYDGLDATLGNNNPDRDDSFGLKCPFQAHIRKTNPRQNDADNEAGDRTRRITRRGIPYGDRNRSPNAFQSLADLPTRNVGLLFACFQKSILDQFSFMQKTWASNASFKVPLAPNNTNSGFPVTGLDPLIGQSLTVNSSSNPEQRWRKEYGGTISPVPASLQDFDMTASHPTACNISNFIKFRGGEFFFAPSLPFLRGY